MKSNTSASPEKHSANENSKEFRKLAKMIQGIQFAMLVTRDEEGYLHSRPMATQQFEFNGDLWFLTSNSTAKSHQISCDPKVNVTYSDPSDQRYISVSGIAEVIQDQSKIKELWNPLYKAWFPKGLGDPSLAAIRVKVEQAEYWDSPSSTMAHLYGLVKATLTGKPARPGDHAKIDIAS